MDFIALLALISILLLYGKLFLRYTGIVYLTLPMLNKWINKKNKIKFSCDVHFFRFRSQIPFWDKFSPKIKIVSLSMKFSI